MMMMRERGATPRRPSFIYVFNMLAVTIKLRKRGAENALETRGGSRHFIYDLYNILIIVSCSFIIHVLYYLFIN